MNSLEPGQLWLMRIHALIAALILGILALVAESVIPPDVGLPRGAVALPVLLLIVYMVFIAPGRHFRAWGYKMDEEELLLRRGVWIQTETIVPLDRIQHIDISQGPLERPLGVCRLLVHTAGTQHSRVVLPGLSRADAERMRDEIRLRIRQDMD
jgi:hypothetical protein